MTKIEKIKEMVEAELEAKITNLQILEEIDLDGEPYDYLFNITYDVCGGKGVQQSIAYSGKTNTYYIGEYGTHHTAESIAETDQLWLVG